MRRVKRILKDISTWTRTDTTMMKRGTATITRTRRKVNHDELREHKKNPCLQIHINSLKIFNTFYINCIYYHTSTTVLFLLYAVFMKLFHSRVNYQISNQTFYLLHYLNFYFLVNIQLSPIFVIRRFAFRIYVKNNRWNKILLLTSQCDSSMNYMIFVLKQQSYPFSILTVLF